MQTVFTRRDDKVMHVAILTDAALIRASIDAPKFAALTQALNAGTPPQAAVHAQTTAVARETVVPWGDLESLSWVDVVNDHDVKLRYRSSPGKVRSAVAALASAQDRSEFLKLARGCLRTKFEKRTEPVSLWYVGAGPIVVILFTLWLGSLTTYAASGGFAGTTGGTTGRRAGKAAMVRFVAETLGVSGSLGLSCAIIAGAVAWWVYAYRKRPNRTVVAITGR